MNKARFEYCQYLYDREFELKDRLEKKAAALFTLPTALIGVLFLNPDATSEISDLFSKYQNNSGINPAIIVFIVFVILLSTTLILAILVITVKKYQKEYQRGLYKWLYEPGRRYLQGDDVFYEEIGGRLAIATQHNGKVNEYKAGILNIAIYFLLSSVLILLLFVLLYYL